jgi:hypothetical protein
MYKDKVEMDVALALNAEFKFQEKIQDTWGVLLLPMPGKFSSLDYKISLPETPLVIGYIELKCRTVASTTFSDTMIDMTKWNAIQDLYTKIRPNNIYIGFRFTDKDMYYLYKPEDQKRIIVRHNSGPNKKRGYPDTKVTIGIPMDLLSEIKKEQK